MKSFLLLILSLMAEENDREEQEETEVEVETDRDGCQQPFTQTVYRTAKATIRCDYPRNSLQKKFFCKENNFTCEDILSTESSPKSSETFTLTKTNTGFTVSISKVSSHHAGVYWCGVKSNEGSYRAAFRKIQLEVKDITIFTRSLTIGQNFTYWCEYPFGAPIKKFICKGEDPSICEPLVNTMQLEKNTGRFSMEDDIKKRNITITVKEVTTDDTGTYWCGAESTDNKLSNPFFHRFSMIVDITIFTRSLTIGQNFTYWCEYPDRAPIRKFICKGEDPSICEPLVNTMQLDKDTRRFSMEDDIKKRNITITVREVTTDDTGTYWCGAESTDNKRSNTFFHRFSMIVGPPIMSPNSPTTSSPSLTQPTTASHESFGHTSVLNFAVCLSLDLLVFLLMVHATYFLFKRYELCKKNRSGE